MGKKIGLAQLGMSLTALVVSVLVGFQLVLFGRQESELRVYQVARQDLRKLVILAYGLWAERGDLELNTLWRRIGRKDPLLDPWGRPYLVRFNRSELECRSLGPDGQIETGDDLQQILPRNISGVITDPESGEIPEGREPGDSARSAQ